MCGALPGMTLTCSTLQFGSAGSPLEEKELAKLIFLRFNEFDLTLHDFNEFDLTLHDFDEFDLTLHDFDEFDITLPVSYTHLTLPTIVCV